MSGTYNGFGGQERGGMGGGGGWGARGRLYFHRQQTAVPCLQQVTETEINHKIGQDGC